MKYQEIMMQSGACHRPCRSDSCNRRRIWTPMVESVSTVWPNPHGQELRQEGNRSHNFMSIECLKMSSDKTWQDMRHVWKLHLPWNPLGNILQHAAAGSLIAGRGAAKDYGRLLYFSKQIHAQSGIIWNLSKTFKTWLSSCESTSATFATDLKSFQVINHGKDGFDWICQELRPVNCWSHKMRISCCS